ncbi:MAG: tetratricopeptide repeat protein [Burkholderiaceae bacterium]
MNTATDPNLPLIERARLAIENGQLAEAAAVLNQARAQLPNDPRVYMMGGLMAEKAGNINGAFQLMERGLSIAPDWAPGIIVLAQLQARQGQYPEAQENAAIAVALEARNPVVLDGAIEVAHRTGNLDQAVAYLRKALEVQPNDRRLRLLLAKDLSQLGQHEEAMALSAAVTTEVPEDRATLEERMHILLAAGQMDDAAQVTATLLALDPGNAIYTYYHARARGETPAHQPAEINRTLFDRTAHLFDQHLQQGLRYRLPQQTAQKILALYPQKKLNLLDLGCGTGLLGAQLGKIDGQMVGTDVSPKMLEQAKRRQLYTRLEVAELHDTLRSTPPGTYDLIAALDVCVYVGDLRDAIPAAWQALVPGGRLVFSCEIGLEDGPDLHLNPATERYVHKRSHVEALCQAAGFAVETELTVLRYEKGQPVQGFVIWARKAS